MYVEQLLRDGDLTEEEMEEGKEAAESRAAQLIFGAQ